MVLGGGGKCKCSEYFFCFIGGVVANWGGIDLHP